MSILENIIIPILPQTDKRLDFLQFLKSVIDGDEQTICVITGGVCTGKSTLIKAAMTVIDEYKNIPENTIFYKSYGAYYHFICDFKLGMLDAESTIDIVQFFKNVNDLLDHPDEFGHRNYLIQGNFDFSQFELNTTSCIQFI